MLNLENMDKFVMAMDFEPRPKLVISLFEAFASFGHNAYDHGHWSYRKGDIDGDPSVAHGEPAGERGLSETERRLGEFIKDSLLPIAIESNAVIIMGANHCSFSSIFSALSQREAARRRAAAVLRSASSTPCTSTRTPRSPGRTATRSTR